MRNLSYKESIRIHCDAYLSDVVKSLKAFELNGAPVINDQNKVIGFISENDCIKAMLKSNYYRDDPVTAADIMFDGSNIN